MTAARAAREQAVQPVMFDAEGAHRLSMLPRLRGAYRGFCSCGYTTVSCRSTDDVNYLHKKHVREAQG